MAEQTDTDHAIHSIQVSHRKRQLLDSASEVYTHGKKNKDSSESHARKTELFQQIGKLQMELE